MKRLDLIISAIEDALKDFNTDSYDNDFHGCCGADVDFGHIADCKLTHALAAARELQELEPVICDCGDHITLNSGAMCGICASIKPK
jgi:hypothetical protein